MKLGAFGTAGLASSLALFMGFTCTSSDGTRTTTWPVTSATPRSSSLSAVPSPSFNTHDYSNIAILTQTEQHDQALEATSDDIFTFRLVNGGYTVPARSDLDTLLGELKLQSSGLTDRALGEIGRFLNVSAILLVRANRCSTEANPSDIGSRYVSACSVSARMLNVERAEVVWVSSARINKVGDPIEVTLALLERLAGTFPARTAGDRANLSSNASATSHSWAKTSIPVTAVFLNDNARRLGDTEKDNLLQGLFSGLLSNGYRVTSREDVDRVITEMKWQSSGLSDRAAAKVGRILNVPAVLIVSLNQADTTEQRASGSILGGLVEYGSISGRKVLAIDASAKLVDVNTSEVLWIRRWHGQFRIPNEDRWRESLTDVGTNIGRGLPSFTANSSRLATQGVPASLGTATFSMSGQPVGGVQPQVTVRGLATVRPGLVDRLQLFDVIRNAMLDAKYMLVEEAPDDGFISGLSADNKYSEYKYTWAVRIRDNDAGEVTLEMERGTTGRYVPKDVPQLTKYAFKKLGVDPSQVSLTFLDKTATLSAWR